MDYEQFASKSDTLEFKELSERKSVDVYEIV